MGRLTSTIGTSMVNDLEFAYSDNRINITPGGTDPALLAATTAGIPPQWPLAFKTFPVGIPTIWGGFGAYGNGQNLWMIAPWTNALDIYTVRDDFSKVMGAHTHSLWRIPGLGRQARDERGQQHAVPDVWHGRTGIPICRPAINWQTCWCRAHSGASRSPR